jgi:hypothetical protein
VCPFEKGRIFTRVLVDEIEISFPLTIACKLLRVFPLAS